MMRIYEVDNIKDDIIYNNLHSAYTHTVKSDLKELKIDFVDIIQFNAIY